LTVGQAGTGTLDILNGAVVSSVNSILGAALTGGGYASLYGAGSAWNHSGDLTVGQVGTGYMSIEAGGVVRNVNASLGRMAGSDGFAKVSGVQSRWISSGELNVGYVGDGSLNILDGGQVSTDLAYIGREGGSGLVTLAGTGSGLDVAKEIWLTRGALNVGAGAVVSARNLLAGYYPVDGAAATVAGAGAKLILAQQLFLGEAGAAALTVGSGGLIQAQNLVIGAAGTLTLAGGTLNLTEASNAGRFVWTAGSVGFSGDARLGAGQLLGTDLSLLAGMNLDVAGRLTLGTDDALTLAGGQAQVGSLVQDGLLTVARFSTLTVGAGGLSNTGELSFEGGTIGGSGALINSGYMSGFGRKIGSGAFINSGLFEQSGGVFELANTTLNVNTGNWDMLGGRELRLSGANLFNAGVMSMSGDTVSGSATLINSTAGTLTGRGVISARFENAGRLTVDAGSFRIEQPFGNQGQILMGSTIATLAGGPITNTGRINGVGQINNEIINTGSVGALGGTLTLDGRLTNTGILSAGPGATLLLNQGLASNAGKIQLAGGTLDNNGKALSNEALGVISGFGTLSGGTLTNKGRVLLSGGSSTVYTEILGANASQIILSGLSNTSFYGKVDVQSGAELRVSTGSVATFFELVQQRTGAKFTGTGTKRFEGGISVGASPGLGTDEGDVEFGDDNVYLAEIGGITACTLLCGTDDGLKNRSFDKYIVDGNLSLGGTLKLVSWNGFVAQTGQRFDLLDWGSLTGSFGSIDASGFKLAAGSALDYSQLYMSGTISVTAVPEPASLALWLAGLGALVTRARRRRTTPLRR
ncbi:MAG: PEP-CTERM sorting domain-containing protein, partial [Burkholderiaceae bacterium]|nr:PEP-CTERM sorting domain-containing protein [Burkholderiaceae bacterium]